MLKTTTSLTLVLVVLLSANAMAADTELAEREAASEAVAAELIIKLGGKLKAELKSNGPVSAISVCREAAPTIANELSLENGWRVTRVSSRPRNAMLGTTDIWEGQTLADFERRLAAGEDIKTMSTSQFVLEDGQSWYRYMKPLPIQGVCLTCHGSGEQIPPAVARAIAENYPHDKATGYALGDLRGAVSIKQPVDGTFRKISIDEAK